MAILDSVDVMINLDEEELGELTKGLGKVEGELGRQIADTARIYSVCLAGGFLPSHVYQLCVGTDEDLFGGYSEAAEEPKKVLGPEVSVHKLSSRPLWQQGNWTGGKTLYVVHDERIAVFLNDKGGRLAIRLPSLPFLTPSPPLKTCRQEAMDLHEQL